MFRKPIKRKEQAVRQRTETSLEEDDSAEIVKDAAKRRRRENPMVQSTKRREQKKDDGSSSSSDDEVVNEHAYTASGSIDPLGPADRGATFTSEKDTSYETDAHAQFERVQKVLKEGGLEKDGKTMYKGMAMYGAKEAKDTAKGNAVNGLNRLGPMRAPQFLRQTVRWDYAPDICKDYKETGFCTFGDSCKFLHDRSDYKHGWEIERDYLAGNLNEVDETNYEIPDDEDSLPEECFICGNPFENPIVTNCKHYFCEACAIKAFKKSKRCKVCNENTGGIFNVAKEIIQKMKDTERVKEEPEESDNSDKEEEHEKDIKQEVVDEEHEHGESCSHHHHHHHDEKAPEVEGIKQEEDSEAGDEEQEEEEQPQEEEEQEPIDINMEEIGEQEDVENSSDVDDEEEQDDEQK